MSYLAYFVNPNTTTLFSFIAFLFPLFLLTNMLFFVYWLIKRKKQFLLPLVTLILGYYHTSRYVQITLFDSEVKDKSTLNIMSYNVRLFDLYNWTDNKTTRDKILTFLEEENPEVICFQEYFYTSGNHFDTRDTLLNLIDAQYYTEHFTRIVNEPKQQGGQSHFGSAIFSKYPILNSGIIEFDNDKSNHATFIDICKNEIDTLRIYNAHLGSIRFQNADYQVIGGNGNPVWPKQKKTTQNILGRLKLGFLKRVSQTEILLEHINNSPYKVVLCSDMNDTPLSYTYGQFSNQLKDSFTESGNGIGGTYVGYYPFLRIDYIWHDKTITTNNFTTHQQKNSDHKAISTTIVY